jgi:hypothetical protein
MAVAGIFSGTGINLLLQVNGMKIQARSFFPFRREEEKRAEYSACGLIFAIRLVRHRPITAPAFKPGAAFFASFFPRMDREKDSRCLQRFAGE